VIRIETVAIENFRGIRNLKLDFNRENFGVFGPNGSGKSGVVDAIEFALTGSITRLTGEGTSGISVKTHAPHVDYREQPETAIVRMDAVMVDGNKKLSIERSVSNPRAPKVTPNDAETLAAFVQITQHPEFALSRREILKYILTEPGKRAQQVQALLKLDELEKIRTGLQKAANKIEAESKSKGSQFASSRLRLLSALGIPEIKTDLILVAVNEKRALLGLAPLAELTKDTSLKEGLGGTPQQPQPTFKVVKSQALADFESLRKLIEQPDSQQVSQVLQTLSDALQQLVQNPALFEDIKKQNFLKSGLDLITDAVCPLCDEPWDIEELRSHIKAKSEAAQAAGKLKIKLDQSAQSVTTQVQLLSGNVLMVAKSVKLAQPEFDDAPLLAWITRLTALVSTLKALDDPAKALEILATGWRQVAPEATVSLSLAKGHLDALPEVSKADQSRDFLTVAQERLDDFRKHRAEAMIWAKRSEQAQKVLTAFNQSCEGVLTGIYAEVEQDFSRYYQLINHEDEGQFRGQLKPSTGKLAFEVDFYGRGFHPPGAYHSEGHQDGMGLCLYLALMKKILGPAFTLAVLDDVLMSVDAGHRKEVCRLLKTEFSNTQFIFTTHDQVWMNYMTQDGLVRSKSVAKFRKWTVEDGPSIWDQKELWTEIAEELDKNNVPGAAQTLRRFLENVLFDFSIRLRAPLESKGTASYDLGELMPAIISTWGRLLSKGKEAAQSWKQDQVFKDLITRHEEFRARLVATQAEQWTINSSVHYTQWNNMQPQEFRPVVEAFRQLLTCFQCPSCEAWYYANPPKGNIDLVRCDCGSLTINLKSKS
jgi:recombinational DNA repair ATPase RecF